MKVNLYLLVKIKFLHIKLIYTFDKSIKKITALFTFEGIGIILPLENKMRNKEGMRGWFGVLNTGMIFVATLYIAGKYL